MRGGMGSGFIGNARKSYAIPREHNSCHVTELSTARL